MNHGSLFSGIGGFDLAAKQAGWENTFHCEWNEFGQWVLQHHDPKAKTYNDITKTDFTIWKGRIDILTGGFPCQPYSTAGKRKGKDDERHLWPEMLRAIREIQPRWIVGENVLGIVNWNSGMVFEEVQADLEAEGYEVQAYVLPASGVNAPHQRYRTWFVAYSNKRNDGGRPEGNESKSGKKRIQKRNTVRKPSKSSDVRNDAYAEFKRLEGENESGSEKRGERKRLRRNTPGHSTQASRSAANASSLGRNDRSDNRQERHVQRNINGNTSEDKSKRCRWKYWARKNGGVWLTPNAMRRRRPAQKHGQTEPGRTSEKSVSNYWQNFPTQSPVRTGDDGFRTDALRQRIREDSMGILSEEEIDEILSKATSRWVKETIKAGGNAVVPPLVLNIFNAINEFERLETS